MKTRFFAFTLLEICLCMMILSLVAAFLGVQIKEMVDKHRFDHSVMQLKMEMQHYQTLALSYQTDLEVEISKKKNKYFFKAFTKDPAIPKHALKKNALASVSKISLNGGKPIDRFRMTIRSSGRVEPLDCLGFHRKELKDDATSIWLDFTQPLLIRVVEKVPKN